MARIGAIPGYTNMFRHVPTHPARSHQPPNLLHLQQHLQAAWLDPDLAGEFPCVATGWGPLSRARVNRWVRCLWLKKPWFMVDIGRYW